MKRALTAAVLLMLMITAAFAEPRKSEFNIAGEFSKYTYKEPRMQYPIRDSGNFYGISTEYLYRGFLSLSEDAVDYNDKSFFAFQLRYMQGTVDYDGFLQDGTRFFMADITQYYIEGRLLFGAEYGSEKVGFAPYLGFGARYLVDKNNESSSAGYRRTSTYVYIPIGANLKFELQNSWSLALNAEYDYFVSGRQNSRLTDVSPIYLNTTNNQNGGYGARFGLRLEKRYEKIGVFFEPFYRYWRVYDSDIQPLSQYIPLLGIIEPFNESHETGLKIGVNF